MALFEEAVYLGPVITDNGSMGAMKDNYALCLFSWDIVIKLICMHGFDGAFYIMPFTFLLLSLFSKSFF